jgi:hypothetical protein
MAFRPVARAEDVPAGQSTLADPSDDHGLAVAVFNAGQCRADPDLRVPLFAVRVRDGVVEVDLP